MGLAELDELQKILDDASQLPVWGAGAQQEGFAGSSAKVSRYGGSTDDILTWIAMREADRARLARLHPGKWANDREYRADSLPERISQAFSDLLFGEDPQFKAAAAEKAESDTSSPDQESLDKLVEENAIPSALRRMEADCSSEGEQWWRVYTDPAESDYPILTFESRLDTVPLFRGRRVVAVAFISIIFSQEVKLESDVEIQTYRRVEMHTDGSARNVLYIGNQTSMGRRVDLSQRPETQNIMPEWNHGLEMMLAGRIPNKIGRDWRLGISDYQGIRDQLFDLNEARTIMAENARLAAKKRAVANRKFVRADGTIDLSKDIFVTDDEEGTDKELGAEQKADFAILEYTFDAAALIAHINELVGTAVTRVGLVEQFVNAGFGATDGGASASGTALRTRLIPTTLAAAGKARYIDDELPKIMVALQLVDELDQASGGCGHQWTDAATPPTIERTSILPEDEDEEVNRHVSAVAGEIESIYTAVSARHPDWTEAEILKEIDRIHADRNMGMPQMPPPPLGADFTGNGDGTVVDPAAAAAAAADLQVQGQ